jgi:hypothetical protein
MEHFTERSLKMRSRYQPFRSPFDRHKLSRNTRLRDFTLPVAARKANCPYLLDVRLFRNFVLANRQRASHYRAITRNIKGAHFYDRL